MNEFESMTTELNQKVAIFNKQAEKYNGQLVYTLTAVGVTYDDEEEYVNVMTPENGQKCFGDFSSAFNAFFALSEKIAKHNDDWEGFAFNMDHGYLPIISGCLLYHSLDELEEKTTEIFSNLGKSESRTFGICDFYAQSPLGITCQVTLFVTDASKAAEEAKAAEDDDRSYRKIIESDIDFDNFSQEIKDILYYACEKAERVEKAFAEKGMQGLCFVKNADNIAVYTDAREKDHEEIDEGIYEECYEEIAFSNIIPFNTCNPYFTSFRAAFKNMLGDILASICPVEADPTRVQFFGTIETSEEKINAILEEIQNGNAVSIFTYIRGDGVSELNIFRDLSVCCIK